MNCLPLFNTVLLVYSGIFLMNSLNSLKQEESTYITYNYIRTQLNIQYLNNIMYIIEIKLSHSNTTYANHGQRRSP